MFTSNFVKNALLSLAFLLLIGIFLYIYTSLLLIFTKYPLSSFTAGNYLAIFFNIFVLFFEFLTAIYGIFLLIHTALVFTKEKQVKIVQDSNSNPLVSLIIPTFNPDIYTVETNLYHLTNLTYKNIEIIITDNSSDKSIVDKLENLTKKFNVTLIHRDGLKGFKAKNLNNALEQTRGEYFIIVDIDQSLKDQAIEKFLSIFTQSQNEKLAYVQGRFEIKNDNSIIRICVAILYTFFYDVVSLAKSYRKTVLFNGSSACFKSEIVRFIGGFPEVSYTEDMAISTVLLMNGYESLYLNDSVTTALVPWKLSTLLTSFWRWAHGGTSCLRLYSKDIIKSNKISFTKKIEIMMNYVSFIAISSILVIIYSMLCMYWFNIEIIRPNLEIYGLLIPLYLIFPVFTSVNHLINCIIGMWESKTLYRVFYLIPYSVASVAISIFIVLPSFYAMLGIKGPDSPNSRWNRKFGYKRVIFLLLVSFGIFTVSFFDSLIHKNLLWISFATMMIVTFSTIIFLLKDFKIDVKNSDFEYFNRFRREHGFKIE